MPDQAHRAGVNPLLETAGSLERALNHQERRVPQSLPAIVLVDAGADTRVAPIA
jgi:hypothetical protein